MKKKAVNRFLSINRSINFLAYILFLYNNLAKILLGGRGAGYTKPELSYDVYDEPKNQVPSQRGTIF